VAPLQPARGNSLKRGAAQFGCRPWFAATIGHCQNGAGFRHHLSITTQFTPARAPSSMIAKHRLQ
jgi:hypothetical protein